MTNERLNELLDEWFLKTVGRKQQQMQRYVADCFTKEEAVRHSDNVQNLMVNEGDLAILKLKLMASAVPCTNGK